MPQKLILSSASNERFQEAMEHLGKGATRKGLDHSTLKYRKQGVSENNPIWICRCK